MTRAALALVLTTLVASGCGSKTESVAELVHAEGDVQASSGTEPGDWQPTATGASFRTGDGVRTGADASARVRVLRGNGVIRMGAGALVRFGPATDDGPRVTLETGDATLEAGKVELSFDTAVGIARVAPGTVLQVRRDDDGRTRVEILVGRAVLESGDVAGLEIGVGDAVEVTVDGVVRRRGEPDVADAGPVDVFDAGTADAGPPRDAAPDAAPDAAIDDARTADGDVRLRGRKIALRASPDTVLGSIRAGESTIVHAPAMPARLRLETADACAKNKGNAVVELRKGRKRGYFAAGRGGVAVEAGPGRHRYRVFCNRDGTLKPTSTRGALVVRRDSGRRSVETSAPRNEIEADGRKYRLLYQNRKPIIVLTWPRAPQASEYEVVVTSESGNSQAFRADEARRTLPSGALSDGTYTWHFRTADGKAQSPTSRLVLDFDNASPAAQIDRVAWVGDKVEVSGVATQGSTVTFAGRPVDVDSHFRFNVRAAVGPRDGGIAIRIVRPAGDVHHYQVPVPRR